MLDPFCVHRCGTSILLWECLPIIDSDICTICHTIDHTLEKEKQEQVRHYDTGISILSKETLTLAGGDGDGTTDPLISGPPALPPKPQTPQCQNVKLPHAQIHAVYTVVSSVIKS